jgi:hypothetical protein
MERQHERWDFTEFNEGSPATVCEGYCLLSGFVASEVMGFRLPADCFCHLSDNPRSNDALTRFRYEKSVYDYDVSAVNQKIEDDLKVQLHIPGSVMSLGKGCECPDYDNRERDYDRGFIVSTTCPLHGFHGTHRVVESPHK